jgi:hypothetical protein
VRRADFRAGRSIYGIHRISPVGPLLMVSAGLLSFMGASAPEERHHDERGEEEDLRGARRAVPLSLHPAHRGAHHRPRRGYDTTGIGYQFIANRLNEVLGVGGWRAHRVVTVKEVTHSNGRPAFEAIADITLELGSWVDGNFIVFAESLADGGHVASAEADARWFLRPAYTCDEGATSKAMSEIRTLKTSP